MGWWGLISDKGPWSERVVHFGAKSLNFEGQLTLDRELQEQQCWGGESLEVCRAAFADVLDVEHKLKQEVHDESYLI